MKLLKQKWKYKKTKLKKMTKTHKITTTEIKNVIILQMTKTYKMTRGGRIKLIHHASPFSLQRFWIDSEY